MSSHFNSYIQFELRISFDPAKSDRNASERGLPFDLAADFEFETAMVEQDLRRDYGEERWIALGLIGSRVHALCFVETSDGIRVISLRKANAREAASYDRARAADG